EDKLREADRLDPEVDTRSEDYQPSVWNDETTDRAPSAPTRDEAGAHRATTEPGASPAPPSGGEPPTRTT
ncbi:MAG: hypothetical protein WB797_15000, partial [Nocardioides sp.]